MKKLVIVFILINMSIHLICQEQKEDIYFCLFTTKTWDLLSMSFVIVDKDLDLIKKIHFHVYFSRKNKMIKYIEKIYFNTREYKFTEFENGNIFWSEKNFEKREGIEYYTSENFKQTRSYNYYNKYLPELLELDNYDLLLYLDNNFTKYRGLEEYRHAPLLKVQRE